MDDTGSTSVTRQRASRPQELDGGTAPATQTRAGVDSLRELHQPLDAAWKAVSEVARLVDEIHHRRGNRRIR